MKNQKSVKPKMRVSLSALGAMTLVCNSVLVCLPVLAQFSISGFTVTADSLQLPPPAEISFSVPFMYAGVTSTIPDYPNFVLVTPSNGDGGTRVAIGLNPKVVPFLPPGQYRLLASFTVDPQPTGPAGRFVNLLVLKPPPPVVTSVVNAATLRTAISPGSQVSIFGSNIGTPPVTSTYNDAGLYPTLLGHSTVTFNGVPAALLYVSNSQINAVVPFEVFGKSSVDVVVEHHGVSSPAISVPLSDASPGIFAVTQNGRGQGAVLNADNSVNSDGNPARKGSPVQIFATGAAPYLVGMLQVNAVIPEGVASGAQPVELTVGAFSNVTQQAVTIAVE